MRTFLVPFLTLAAAALPSLAQADELPMLATTQGVAFEAAPGVEASPETDWNSPALAVTGSIVAGVGVAATITGAVMYAQDPCTSGEDVEPAPLGVPSCGMGFGQAIGGITMLGGAGLVLIGAPLIVAGAWQVESDDRGIPPTTAELRVGPGRADLAVSF